MSMTPSAFRAWLSSAVSAAFGGNRNIYKALGYPEAVSAVACWHMYRRMGVATRLIKAPVDATWRQPPVVEALNAGENDALRAEFEALDAEFGVVRAAKHADRLARIGRYGALLVGIGDGRNDWDELGEGRLLYLRAVDETSCTVADWERDPTSPRYGLPSKYRVNLATDEGGGGQSLYVHHTRIVHITEDPENAVFAEPKLAPVFNRLMDLDKVAGGSAEAAWLTGNRGLALMAQSDVEMTPDDRREAREQAQDYQDGVSRVLALQGMDVKSLGAEMASPADHADVLLTLIASGSDGIPKRLLIGNEQGEMASSQDETNWAGRVSQRRADHAAPSVVRPLVNILMAAGVLTSQRFVVRWDEGDGLGEESKANRAKALADAVKAFSAAPEGERVMTIREFREKAGLPAEPPSEEPEIGDDEMGATEGDGE